MNPLLEIGGRPIDMSADDNTEVEIQREVGTPDRYKLYIHQNGITRVRICKLKAEQINTNNLFKD